MRRPASLRCPAAPSHAAYLTLQARVVLDPYSKAVFNGRRRFGEMGPVSAPLPWLLLQGGACAWGWVQAGRARAGWARSSNPPAQLSYAASLPQPSAQDLPYGEPGVLGYAATWPQAAAALPQPAGAAEFDWEGDRPLGLPMEDLVRGGQGQRGGCSSRCCARPQRRPGP